MDETSTTAGNDPQRTVTLQLIAQPPRIPLLRQIISPPIKATTWTHQSQPTSTSADGDKKPADDKTSTK
jgi:hypothetical protein